MGHHNPRHIRTDLEHMKDFGCDDVLVAAQENDFVHMVGKIDFTPAVAAEIGLRPITIFWGVLNLFGGGKSSQFLLQNPAGFQVTRDGGHFERGCYVNPLCTARIKEMIDTVVEKGFSAYFVDEPTPMDCYCPSCRARYEALYGESLAEAGAARTAEFRRRCVIDYICEISGYCKANHPALETQCCLMPSDKELWGEASKIEGLDNLGTDIYWANRDNDVQEMAPMVRELDSLCRGAGKKHHEWLQAWKVKRGNEPRITAQGEILLREKPDALYVWAYLGQVGTTEASEDPEAAWAAAEGILRRAKNL